MRGSDARRNVRLEQEPLNGLLTRPPVVVNVGLEGFARELEAAGAHVVHLDWSPPAGGDPRMAALLAKLVV